MSKALTRKRAPVGSIGTIRHAGADSLVFRDEFSSGTTSLFFVVCPISQRRAGHRFENDMSEIASSAPCIRLIRVARLSGKLDQKAKVGNVFGHRRKQPKMFRAGLLARSSANDQQTLPKQSHSTREYAARRAGPLQCKCGRLDSVLCHTILNDLAL